MRHLRLILLALAFSLAAQTGWAIQYASIVVDARTGKVLHAVNPDERAYPASLTKMMTLYLTFESLRAGAITLNQKFKVSALAESRAPSKLGLRRGQTIAVRDAIGALVTKSANDVATVVAENIGETEPRFAQQMTAKALQLGMTNTTFRNASGLPNRSQVTTARDMVKLVLALQRDFPEYYRFFSLKNFEYRGQSYRNHNRLLGRYDGTDGVKTGYVHESGFNIALSSERNGHRLITVVFGGKSAVARDNHAIKLMDQAFEALSEGRTVVANADEPVKPKARAKTTKAAPKPARSRTVATSEPVAVATADTTVVSDGGWSVQVGAFNRHAAAHLAATRAAAKVKKLASARVAVIPGEARQGQIYRARLMGLTERVARDACRQLKRQKIGCMVVKSDIETAEGDR